MAGILAGHSYGFDKLNRRNDHASAITWISTGILKCGYC